MKVARSPAFLEGIANSPRVRPWIGGAGPVHAGETWRRTVALEWDDGGVVFMRESPGVYSAHLVFQRKARDVLDKCREALRDLFTRQGAAKVVASFPPRYRHVRAIAEAAGMRRIGEHDGLAHYALSAREWAHTRK